MQALKMFFNTNQTTDNRKVARYPLMASKRGIVGERATAIGPEMGTSADLIRQRL